MIYLLCDTKSSNKLFKKVTAHLQEEEIPYQWGLDPTPEQRKGVIIFIPRGECAWDEDEDYRIYRADGLARNILHNIKHEWVYVQDACARKEITKFDSILHNEVISKRCTRFTTEIYRHWSESNKNSFKDLEGKTNVEYIDAISNLYNI